MYEKCKVTKNMSKGKKNMRKDMKNMRNPYILRTLLAFFVP